MGVEEQLMRRLWNKQWTRWVEPWEGEAAGRQDREPRAGRTVGDHKTRPLDKRRIGKERHRGIQRLRAG